MNQKEIKELIEFLVDKDIAEFQMERGDLKLHVKRGGAAQPAPIVHVASAPVQTIPFPPLPTGTASGAAASAGGHASAVVTPSAATEPAESADLFIVKSPIVGTYYEAPSPGAPPFVKVGDAIQEGQVLCIIEAMKLMNEIEAEVSGVLAKMFVSNGSPVEYGMPLFGIQKS